MKITKLSIVLFFASTSFLNALECSKGLNVRLDKNNEPFSYMPMYSQGELGTCYAYSAAQLLDYKRIKAKGVQSDLISPNFLAVQYYSNVYQQSTKIDGGSAFETLKVAKTFGACLQSSVKDAVYANTKVDEKEYINALTKLFEYRNDNDLFKEQYLQFEFYLKKDCQMPEKFKPLQDMIALQKIMLDINDPAAYVYSLQQIFEKACSKNKVFLEYKINYKENSKTDRKSYSQVILENLLQKNPSEVSYCGGILRENENEVKYKNYLTTKNGFRVLADKNFEKKCYPHSSVISGVKEEGSRCKFLIRNSWGSSCNGYGQGWACEENAGVWIDADLLEKNTFSSTNIE